VLGRSGPGHVGAELTRPGHVTRQVDQSWTALSARLIKGCSGPVDQGRVDQDSATSMIFLIWATMSARFCSKVGSVIAVVLSGANWSTGVCT
jgi:hypothetical protein